MHCKIRIKYKYYLANVIIYFNDTSISRRNKIAFSFTVLFGVRAPHETERQ